MKYSKCLVIEVFINLSNCHSLKDIRFEYCNSISTIMTDGADAIETVTFGYNVGIDGTLDLSGKTSLKQIILENGNVECKVLDLSGCTSLEKIVNSDNYYISTENCNISACPLLDKLNISFSSTSDQALNAENSGLTSLTIHNLNFSFDFTSVPGLQELKLQNTRASIDLDLTACSSILYATKFLKKIHDNAILFLEEGIKRPVKELSRKGTLRIDPQ